MPQPVFHAAQVGRLCEVSTDRLDGDTVTGDGLRDLCQPGRVSRNEDEVIPAAASRSAYTAAMPLEAPVISAVVGDGWMIAWAPSGFDDAKVDRASTGDNQL